MTCFGWRRAAALALAFAPCACSRDGGARRLADAGADASVVVSPESETERIYLSGQGSDDAVDWDFSIDRGARAGSSSRIPVPSHWELAGFGTLDERGSASGETGTYRRSFQLPARWARQRVWLVFEGVMTDASVSVNGQSAGPAHQGGFYRFEYDVSELVAPGDNQLEVVVSERSSNESVNAVERSAEHWSLGGIYRPVYLEVYPEQFIERLAVDARPNGDIDIDVHVQNPNEPARVVARLFDASVRSMGPALSADLERGRSVLRLSGHFDEIDPWIAELSTRYLLEVELRVGDETRHVVRERIGFRSVELVPGDGVHVNGRKVRLRGLARGALWPDTGLAGTDARSVADVGRLKAMNANAVRSARRPSEPAFLLEADNSGLYVLEELASTSGAHYDLEVGQRLVQELVSANVNHPSVVLWGNSAFSPELDAEFARWDPTHRPVLHAAAAEAAIDTLERPSYAELSERLARTLTLPTALTSALYDGGGGAALDDLWAAIAQSPLGAGAFVSRLSDELLVLPGGAVASGAELDGVLDAERVPEGSFYTLRELWSPVQIEWRSLPTGFNGSFPLHNATEFLDLAFVIFRWRLANFHFGPGTGFTVVAEGAVRAGSVVPGSDGELRLPLPPGWLDADSIQLEALDLGSNVIGKWAWMLQSPRSVRERIVDEEAPGVAQPADAGVGSGDAGPSAQASGDRLEVVAGDARYTFDTTSGLLVGVSAGGSTFSFGNGPVLAQGSAVPSTVSARAEGNEYLITATYEGDLREVSWRVLGSGWLALSYRYAPSGSYPFFGVSFDYPEALVQSVQWLGRGPGRVWKNRLKGTWHDVWSSARRASPSGWDDAKPVGYFADVYWARLATSEGRIDLVIDDPGTYLGLFSVGQPPVQAAFPAGGISFLQGIAPIGDAQLGPEALGPQGAPYILDGTREINGSVYLRFDGRDRAPAAQ
jgi:glycosyl hydrolase family 2